MSGSVGLLKAVIWSATFGVMFSSAVRVGPGSLRRVREHPALFARTLLGVWILVPAFTVAVVAGLGVGGLSATMLLLMAVCPGLPSLVASTRSVRGSMATAMLALLLTAITEPFLLPFWTRILSAFHPLDLRVQGEDVLRVLLPTVFLPIVLGFGLRAAWLRLATALARVSDVVYLLGVAIKGIVVVVEGAPLLRHVPVRAFAAATIITVVDALIGFWVARPDPEDQRAIALATALGNPALAMEVVEVIYPDHQASALVAAYLIVRALSLAPFEWWLKRTADLRAAHRSARQRTDHG